MDEVTYTDGIEGLGDALTFAELDRMVRGLRASEKGTIDEIVVNPVDVIDLAQSVGNVRDTVHPIAGLTVIEKDYVPVGHGILKRRGQVVGVATKEGDTWTLTLYEGRNLDCLTRR